MKFASSLATLAVLMFSGATNAETGLLSMQERAAWVDSNTEFRFSHVLPDIMRREGIDMWVLISREYNEDPVLETMLPADWLSARRRTILVIFDPGAGKPLERWAIARYDVGNLFKKAWDPQKQPHQFAALAQLIATKQPNRIGINKSVYFNHADGLAATDHELLVQALSDPYRNRLVSAEYLAVGWLETRSEAEMAVYPALVALGHQLIARAFSREVITPGVTTTEQVEWWLREQTRAHKLTNWFHPSVSIQRSSQTKNNDFSSHAAAGVIQPGDLLHVDFGMTYLRLNSDQQQHAYVLRPGETQAPDYLQQALANANRLQDIFTSQFLLGRSGNQVLKASREQAISEGITPSIYTHPIGFHGHAAGTTLGMWDAQGGVPVEGDYPLHANTAYSIELNAATDAPQWGGAVRIMLEEQAWFDGKSVHYLNGRQTQLLLIEYSQ
ncbi:M24 family metallopeptidase [Alteromonas aestuariivivens]|uniref:M24 family metallopeptidase n=1 Tax=Alteromonas aestuariivivens TaxID=1938339 RepID=A0A3D8M945_9ALTE|nr:M24 family metallopeptidase [Alteromonas aestuariivivens]RDV26136.1 M24 family metallopeptidase [Alteromonas aestuariivivens]